MKGTIRPSHVHNNPRMSMQIHKAKNPEFIVAPDMDSLPRQAFDWRSVAIAAAVVGAILLALLVVLL